MLNKKNIFGVRKVNFNDKNYDLGEISAFKLQIWILNLLHLKTFRKLLKVVLKLLLIFYYNLVFFKGTRKT